MIAISSMSNSAVRIAFIIPPSFFGIEGRVRVVAEQALMFSRLAQSVQRVLVNGTAGIVSWLPGGQRFSAMGFTVEAAGLSIDVLSEPARFEPTRFDGLQPMKFRLDG